MICSQCKTTNPRGTLFCNICFTPLNGDEKKDEILAVKPLQISNAQVQIEPPRLIILENSFPTGQTINLPCPPCDSALLIGRTDLKNSIVVDIDVTIYGGLEKGVSRKHAKILYENNSFFIEDWESSLGTFINKEKLSKGVQKVIKNNDEIRFANFITRFKTVL
jgi:hypothetical protein